MRLLALDGHDGAGKTTLARALAERMHAHYLRPFGGEQGRRLMRAYDGGDSAEIMRVGAAALSRALAELSAGQSAVLDRGWLTVATLVPADVFMRGWQLWLPTVLIWCDLPTTLARLNSRDEAQDESDDWHARFLQIYLDRAALRQVPVVRTDRVGMEACVRELEILFARSLNPVRAPRSHS